MSVKIDTAVFDIIDGVMAHFSKSISDIQRHIDFYLECVTQEFDRQLEKIENLLEKAKKDEEVAKDNVGIKENEWKLKIQETERAKSDRNVASDEMHQAKKEKEDAQSEKDAAKADLVDAYNDKQNAYYDMKDRIITYDDFQECVAHFHAKKAVYIEKKETFYAANANFKSKSEHLKAMERELKEALLRQKIAKKAYDDAIYQHKKALKEYWRRKSNLKEAKKIHTQFKMHYADYYRYYFPGESLSCDTLLTMLRSSMKREFDENMKRIKDATYAILRCSLKENISVEAISVHDTHRFKKSKETRSRMKEQFRETMKELNQNMGRHKDEQPDVFEVCSRCHLPMYLCDCTPPDNPEKHY